MDELNESPLVNFFKSNLIVLSLGLLGVIFAGLGLYQLLISDQSEEVVIESESVAKDVKGVEDESILVDIEGAVRNPGVYELKPNMWMRDVVSAAGGLAKDANLSFVAKSLNMAAKIQDGMKIYVPFEGEEVTGSAMNAGLQTSAITAEETGGLINVNSASASELDSLPGVGPATSAKIISLRPYVTIDDLLAKKAVGSSVFAKIKEKIIAQ